MDVIRSIWNWIASTIGDMFYDMMGEALAWAILIGILALLVVPVYVLMKMFSRRKTTFRQDLEELSHPPMPTQEQLENARKIADVGAQVRTVYRYFLVFIIVLGTGFVIYLFRQFSKDTSKSFLDLYFGVGYVVFMLFAVGQLIAARPQAGRHSDAQPENREAAPRTQGKVHTLSASLGMKLGSEGNDVNLDWSFGRPPHAPNENLKPDENSAAHEIDESKLIVAHAYMTSGQSLDSICGLLNPEFGKWSSDQQRAYRDHLSSRLNAMKGIDES